MQPSLLHFIQSYQQGSPADRQQLKDAYLMMQTMRMSPYDLSDVAYDAYLLNGHTSSNPWQAMVKIGDTVRLRFIDASGSTIYHVKIPGTTMQIIQKDGQDIVPFSVNDFEIAPGETYDVLIKIKQATPSIIYAESIDTLGKVLGALITQAQQVINFSTVTPFPEPKPIMMMMPGMTMSAMSHADMSHNNMADMNKSSANMSSINNMQMNNSSVSANKNILNSTTMNNMSMPSQNNNSATELPDVSDPTTKYQNLISMVKTNDPNIPVQIIKIKLNGYMGRYIWFINDEPEYNAKPILIEPGKRYRLIFINETMMHHPMHVHGHWFILRNGHGAYDPLVHTIDVPPNATVVADLDADAKEGIWYFHCHNINHMMTGMATEFIYPHTPIINQPSFSFTSMSSHMNDMQDMNNNFNQNYVPSIPVEQSRIYNSNFLDINSNFDNFTQATFNALIGTDDNKLNLYSNEAELKDGDIESADMDIFYWHAIGQFWAIKGGANYVYRPAETPYLQPGIGIEGLMPYFIETDIRSYLNEGGVKLDAEFSRDTQLTNNFFIRVGIHSVLATKTITDNQIGSGLNEMEYSLRPYYRLMPGLDIYAQYQHTNNYGVMKNILQSQDEPGYENTFTVGFSVLF